MTPQAMVHSKTDLEVVISKWSLPVTCHTMLVSNGHEFFISFLLGFSS